MKNKITILTIVALILGILAGYLIPDIMNNLSFLGTIYINLLKFVIIPIIFTTVIVTIYNTKGEKISILIQTTITFIILFVITFLLTSIIVTLINPASKTVINLGEWTGEIASLNISEIIINLFPSNIVTMIQDNSIFACILIALFSGFAATKVDNGNKAIEVFDSLKNIFNKLLEWIIVLTPIGVFSLVGSTVTQYGTGVISIGAKYIGVAYLCSFLTLLFIMILPVWLYAKINPKTYIKNMWKLWIMTLTTCSSAATLPYTIQTCKEKFNIPDKTANLLVPFNSAIHKCGGAVSFALLGIFCSNLFGIPITFTTYLIMLVGATSINIAAPGIPSGGIVLGAAYLSMLNIPVSFIGVYSGIYKLLDMAYTTLNVTGNVSTTILLNQINKKKASK